MPQLNPVIAGAAAQRFEFGGYLNSMVIQNEEAGAGLFVRVTVGDQLVGNFLIQPSDSLIINAEDTSTNPNSGKIFAKAMTITGQATGPVTLSVIFTTKFFAGQPGRGMSHPVEV